MILSALTGSRCTSVAGNKTKIPDPETSRSASALGRRPTHRANEGSRWSCERRTWLLPDGFAKRIPRESHLSLSATGFRNEYDIAFAPNGELFHLRRRHGMGCRFAMVSPNACLPRCQRRRIWLAKRKRQMAQSTILTACLRFTKLGSAARQESRLEREQSSPRSIRTRCSFPIGATERSMHVQLEPVRRLMERRHKEIFCSSNALPVTDLTINPERRKHVLSDRRTSQPVGSLPRSATPGQ